MKKNDFYSSPKQTECWVADPELVYVKGTITGGTDPCEVSTANGNVSIRVRERERERHTHTLLHIPLE